MRRTITARGHRYSLLFSPIAYSWCLLMQQTLLDASCLWQLQFESVRSCNFSSQDTICGGTEGGRVLRLARLSDLHIRTPGLQAFVILIPSQLSPTPRPASITYVQAPAYIRIPSLISIAAPTAHPQQHLRRGAHLQFSTLQPTITVPIQ